MRLRIFVFVFVLLHTAACARTMELVGLDGNASETGSAATEAAAANGENPLDLTISQAFIENGMLNVKVLLEPKTELDPRAVSVSLIGLSEGDVVGEVSKKASDVYAGQTLEPGEMLAMRFELDATELSEYQVKCNWGPEAREITGTPAGEPSRASLAKVDAPPVEQAADLEEQSLIETEVRETAEDKGSRVPVQKSGPGRAELRELRTVKGRMPCSKAPCDVMYTVVGELVNDGGTPIEDIQLAIGLYWANDGQEPVFPSIADAPSETEEVIALEGVQLQPGESKRLRINVDRPVPIVPGGRFVPHLRLLGFQAES